MVTKPHLTKKKTPTKAKLKRSPKGSDVKTDKAVAARVAMPRPFGFTKEVLRTLWTERGLFSRLFLVTTVVALLLFGATQQAQYVSTADALNVYATEFADKGFDATVHFGLLLTTAATGGLNTTLSETQKVYFSLLYLLVWLVTIWLLRHRLADIKVLVRDGLYNAGAPIVTLIALFFVGAFQLIPMAVGVIVYSAAVTSGVMHGVVETVLFLALAIALSLASLYWIAGTVIAIMIGTNPGTYPVAALKAAKKIVKGQRARLMFHFLWLALLLVILWAIILVPAVLLDSWLHLSWVPIVVLSIQVLTSFSIIFGAAYTYLLYRKMIDEPAK